MKNLIISLIILCMVSVTNAQDQVRKIGEDTYKEYRMEMYSDETSKIFDANGNWVHFYTEYETNEFTGEITSNPIKTQSFIPNDGKSQWWADIFEAYIEDKNGYCLQMVKGLITIKTPNGCVLYIDNFSIIHDPYPLQDKEPDQIIKETEFIKRNGINRNGYIPQIVIKAFVYKDVKSKLNDFMKTKEVLNTNYYVKGSDEKNLKQIRNKRFLFFPSTPSLRNYINEIKEGFYDESTHRIFELQHFYYLQLCSLRTGLEGEYFDEDVVAIRCLPTDTITRFIYYGNMAEIHYSNGDYLKYSYLKNIIYDCLIHRSDGVFTIKLEDNKLMARFEYTSGVFAGYTYYEDSEHDITMYYSPYSILGINNFIELQGSDVFYETKTNRKLEYYGGSLIDAETRAYVVLSEEKKQELDMEKIEKQKKQAELQPLYQKYGKKYVDALFNEGKILVGAPEDLVKKHTQSTLVSETQSTRTYKIKGVFNDWASIVDVDVQTKKVIAVRNRTL